MTSLREHHAWHWLSVTMPMTGIVAFHFRHPWLFLLGLITAILVGDTVIDVHVGDDGGRRAAASIGWAVPRGFICLWMFAVYVAASHARHMAPVDFVGVTVASGILSAFAMAHIHEVMHRGGCFTKLVSDLALTLAGYPHYRLVHKLHHTYVGDPRYGSTAHVGLTLWRHVGCSFTRALLAVLRHDWQQCRTRQTSELLWPPAAWSGTLVAFATFDGMRGALFYLGQSAISVFVVEGIGYIQHYGLSDRDTGKEEQIAWDVDSWLSNRLFANNGLHTHHHLEQTRPYDSLKNVGATLPAGYLHMFLLALVPSLWFSVMDRRLKPAATISDDKAQD